GMGYLAQETSVFRKLSVEQNVLAVLEAIPMHRTIGRKLTRRERLDMTDKVLNQFGLSHLRKNNAARLSGGEKRRLEIARCLVADPLLILLDEPFTGIDPPTIADIKEIIRSLREQNIGILITDHQAREILTVADRVYLIHQGKVFLKGTPGEVASNEQAIRTYLGHTAEGLNFGDSGTAASSAAPARARPSLRNYVEQDRLQTLVDHLRGEDVNLAAAASVELVRQGPVVIPYLVESLAWRDLEMRLRAHDVLQQVWPGVPLDPQAPESERLMQLAHIRSRLERRAS
ncbi:MAG: ATP-binding cassette domain-containing protein, partial [Gemmataceae bacterium]